MDSETANTDQDASVAQSHTLPAAPAEFAEPTRLNCPVVGIDASAGGIEALLKFFRGAPVDSGIAFVVTQHLPPDNAGLMPEILSRCTAMPVKLIAEGMAIEPNTVYVIRPGSTVTLAEAANRCKDDFISMVSHELRTPLNTMRLWMRLLRNEALPAKNREEGQRVLERCIDAQHQLIEDLLDVSRIAAGKLRLEVRPTRLAETIGAAVEAVRPVSDRKGLRIAYRVSPDVGMVRADPDRIQQVVWNLLSNAVKFTPSSGRVDVEVEREGEVVVIKVMDTGMGIRKDLLPHIFDRFQQGASGSARYHSGLGLGLAIAKQLVQLHEGSIAVTSEGEGKGACFIVSLPLKVERVEVDRPRLSRALGLPADAPPDRSAT